MNDMFIGHSAGWYDPPDEATHGECAGCGEVFDYGDMDEIDGEYYCRDCAELVRLEDGSDEIL